MTDELLISTKKLRELAWLKGSRLYPGSWREWIRDPARPLVKGRV